MKPFASATLVFLIALLVLVCACGPTAPTASTVQASPTDAPTSMPTPSPTPTLSAPDWDAVDVSFVDSGQRLGTARSWDVALGDLDGDGDLDGFVANDVRGDAPNAIWLNDGGAQGGTPGRFTVVEQSLGYGMGVALGDLDDDGDLDAFVVGWDEASQVWWNDGGGRFSDSGQVLGDAGGWDVALGDLDGDGDLDAVIAQTEANTVWLNDGTGVFTDTGQRLGSGITAVVALDDLDGDGDLDALTAGWDEAVKVWLNDGAGHLTDNGHSLTSGRTHVHGMAVGDLDNDGDVDAYIAGGSGQHQIWLNDGAGILSDSGQKVFSPAAAGVALGDLDGDDDIDVFAAIGDWGSSDDEVWLNDGGLQGGTTGQFSASGLSLSADYSSDVALGDLDGDGDLDAFVVHGDLLQGSGGGMPNEVWLNDALPQ